MPKPLIVQFTPIRSCLVNLPNKWANALLDQKKLPQNVILELSFSTDKTNSKKIFCGWSGEASKPLPPNSVFIHGANGKLDVLEMDPQFGLAVGLQDGQKVNVEFCKNVPECTTVNVEPLTEDDWEILELHAGYVEENLLSQIRSVYMNQIMCVWIHGKTLVRLAVGEINPTSAEHVKLTNQTEVIVAPKVRRPKTQETEELKPIEQKKTQQQPSVALRVTTTTTTAATVDPLSIQVHPDSLSFAVQSPIVRLTKLVPTFLSNNNNNNKKKDDEQGLVAMSPVLGDIDAEPLLPKSVFTKLIFNTHVPVDHVVVGSALKDTLDLHLFDLVKVSMTPVKKTPLGSVTLRKCIAPTSSSSTTIIKLGLDQQKQQHVEQDVANAFKMWLSQCQPDLVLTHGLLLSQLENNAYVVQLGQKKGFFGNNTSDEPVGYAVVDKVEQLSIEFGDDVPKPANVVSSATNEETRAVVLGGVEKTFQKMEQYTLANVSNRTLKSALGVPGSGGVLVSGSHGSGKTSLVKQLLASVQTSHLYTKEINCSEIAEERIPVFKDMLQRWFDEAAWHGPSVLFFDDLDRLIPAEVEHADSTRSRHLAELFVRHARMACQRHPIMLIATTQQQQSLHPALITHHIFSELTHLQPPNRDERKWIMEAIMANGPTVLQQSLPHIDLVSVASETEGFLAADIKAFVERAVHEGAVRSIKKKLNGNDDDKTTTLELIQQDFTKAREGFVPSSLRGVKLQSSGVNWSDIGGLNETRKALLETLEWPTKYAAVFAQCPLRLRSGLLLYGYPGCGKTLLASAVAKECGLNFISVKGPEILNKYIGASEKSVRDLFERAQAAKPCVLFFDEFDSIAPRRGHDSTGVTDRVVNQMLTQMDGAEGLDGVYVLAATSRPDLIDPALLRPGRLDKALLCGMPTFDERLEILEALSKKMTLAKDVDLKVYADKTEGFSGADLQGFLYNAHLEAIHGAINMETFKEIQNNKSNKEGEGKSDFIIMNQQQKVPLTLAEKGHISQRLAMIKSQKSNLNSTSLNKQQQQQQVVHENNEAVITNTYLEKSLKSTRPSITVEEAHRLGLIYNEFVTGRTGELPNGEGDKGIGKRSTLG